LSALHWLIVTNISHSIALRSAIIVEYARRY